MGRRSALLAILLAGCTEIQSERPEFSGVVRSLVLSDSRIFLAWQDGEDDLSAPSELRYALWWSKQGPPDTREAEQLLSAEGQLSVVLSGLEPATTYHILVRCRDRGDQDSTNEEALVLTTAEPGAGLQKQQWSLPEKLVFLTPWRSELPNGSLVDKLVLGSSKRLRLMSLGDSAVPDESLSFPVTLLDAQALSVTGTEQQDLLLNTSEGFRRLALDQAGQVVDRGLVLTARPPAGRWALADFDGDNEKDLVLCSDGSLEVHRQIDRDSFELALRRQSGELRGLACGTFREEGVDLLLWDHSLTLWQQEEDFSFAREKNIDLPDGAGDLFDVVVGPFDIDAQEEWVVVTGRRGRTPAQFHLFDYRNGEFKRSTYDLCHETDQGWLQYGGTLLGPSAGHWLEFQGCHAWPPDRGYDLDAQAAPLLALPGGLAAALENELVAFQTP